jgi:hypothetical protein
VVPFKFQERKQRLIFSVSCYFSFSNTYALRQKLTSIRVKRNYLFILLNRIKHIQIPNQNVRNGNSVEGNHPIKRHSCLSSSANICGSTNVPFSSIMTSDAASCYVFSFRQLHRILLGIFICKTSEHQHFSMYNRTYSGKKLPTATWGRNFVVRPA